MSSFRVHCYLDAFEKADDENPMRVGGIVTTDSLDRQDEKIIQSGLDFNPFLTKGWFNDNHGQKATDILGYPSSAHYVQKGDQLPNGRRADANGWWAEGYLLNTEEGRRIWGLTQALAKSPRRLGFSIEGKVQKRDPKNPNVIQRAIVKNVAITHCPVNTDTEMNALVKALTAGSAVAAADIGTGPGDGGALRTESLDASVYSNEGPESNQWIAGAIEEQDPTKTDNIADGQGDDANNGGWGGLNPHTTAIRSPQDGLPPRQRVVKAEVDRDFGIYDEQALAEDWAPALARGLSRATIPTTLSKSESRIILRNRYPHLNAAQIDEIIVKAA